MRENYWTRRRFSRRTVLKASAAGAVGAGALVAVGCGDDDDDDGPAPAATAAATAAATEAAATGAAATEAAAAATATAAAATEAAAAATEAAAMGAVDGSFFSQYTGIGGTTLDLHQEQYRGIAYTAGNAYNNLLKFTDMDNFIISGEIARGLPEQPDELTYQFTIRDDVKYHNKPPANGRALTMDDIRWNIERNLTDGSATGSYLRAPLYSKIASVDYVDETHFTVKVAEPQVTWLGDMTDEFNAILYPDIGEKLLDEDEFGIFHADNVLGTGPFIFDEFVLQERAHGVRNDDYFLRKDGTIPGMVDELFFVNLGGDINPQRLAFEQKQIDELSSRDRAVMEEIADGNSEVEAFRIGDPNNNLEFAYNYTTNLSLSDERIRTAMFLATDRALVAEQHFQGLARPNPAVNWPFTAWALSQEELSQAPGYRQPKDQDIADARALWEQADAESRDDLDFRLTTVETPSYTALLEWVPAMYNTNLDTEKWSAQAIPGTSLLEYNQSGQASVGYLGGWDQWTSPDPRLRFAKVYATHPDDGGKYGHFINFWKYGTPEMESYIEAMFTEFDNEKAQEIMKDAQRFALTDAGAGHIQMAGGLTSWVKWPYLHRKGPFFITYGTTISQELWIDQNDPTFEGKQSPA